MNELLGLLQSSPTLVEVYQSIIPLKDWVMNMSILNLVLLVFIIWSTFSISAETSRSQTVNGYTKEKVNKTPKYLLVLLVLSLMFMFPNNLLYASSVYIIFILMLIFWQKPVLWFIGLFAIKEF